MTRSQRWMLVFAGIVGALVFLALTIYFAVAATGHPRVKHMVLFVILAAVSALISWFSLPEGMLQSRRRI